MFVGEVCFEGIDSSDLDDRELKKGASVCKTEQIPNLSFGCAQQGGASLLGRVEIKPMMEILRNVSEVEIKYTNTNSEGGSNEISLVTKFNNREQDKETSNKESDTKARDVDFSDRDFDRDTD